MKRIFILISIILATTLISCQSQLQKQNLDYTENPVDIPNPDRGFYRPQSYVVPVDSGSEPTIPDLKATIAGTDVKVDSALFTWNLI